MRRTPVVAILVVIAAVLAAVAVTVVIVNSVALAEPADHNPSAPVTCDWDTAFAEALEERGENRADWTIVPEQGAGPGLAWTYYRTLTAVVTRDLPCDHVASAVNHEWMHLQQARMYGWRWAEHFYSAVPEWMEIVADCGSSLLGSSWVPYLHDGPCTVQAARAAETLIAFGRGPG